MADLRAPMTRAGLIGTVALLALLTGCGAVHLTPVPDDMPPPAGAPTPAIDLDAPGRSAIQLEGWAQEQHSATGIPVVALEAYGYAAAVMARSKPECGIGWTTLAGIASVESHHGSHGGSQLNDDGTVAPPIRGLALDGSPGRARILDAGSTEANPIYVRAMGPFQFIPETWQRWGVDANGDGKIDADNIDDAALTAARYLCAMGGNLTTVDGWQKALLTYNQSTTYMDTVRYRAAAYSVGRKV